MLGTLSYEEMIELSKSLSESSKSIRTIIENYGDDLSNVIEFCDSIDSYSKFIDSNVSLNKDADQALQYMIEKNKQS